MKHILLSLTLAFTCFLCWRNLWQAYRSGSIRGRGSLYRLEGDPVMFLVIAAVCLMAGIACPILIAHETGLIG